MVKGEAKAVPSERDYHKDVAINRFRLEVCSEEQSSLSMYYREKEAEARAVVEQLKHQEELLKSDLKQVLAAEELRIRQNTPRAIGYEFEKWTEASISAAVLVTDAVKRKQAEITKVQEQLLVASDVFNHMQAAVSSFDDRRASLRDLTSLFLGGYYARPEGATPTTAGDGYRQELRSSLKK